jgi:sugar fermentation stimulation protein A
MTHAESGSTAPDAGTYILLMEVERACTITVGRLGAVTFPPGHYLYVGSALRNLSHRLARHLRRDKRVHWHIDTLLAHARIVEIWYRPGRERLECTWARALAETPGLVPWGRRFGSSDCRCATHLYYAAEPPVRETVWRGLPGTAGIAVWA